MTDDANNLILTQLRAMRDDISDVKTRLANIEATQATTLQHLDHVAGSIAQVQVGIDRQATRLGRIEDRLDMSDTPQPPLFLLDANACNSLQRIDELNDLERMAEEGVIDLLYTEATWDEAQYGSSKRMKKVNDYLFIGLSIDEHSDQIQQPWRDNIGALVFPDGIRTDNQRRDVDALLTVKMSGGIFVTRDGGSKSQPGGILGFKVKLAELGIEVLNFADALTRAGHISRLSR